MVTDPIADFLVRIENASRARKVSVEIPFSSIKEEIAKLLVREGYVESVEVEGAGVDKSLVVSLKYATDKTPRLNETRRVSKPSRRMYLPYKDIKSFKYGKGRAVFSTPKGILTDVDAKKEKVGGEILFTVW